MRKYTYINTKTGKRVYSDTPIKEAGFKLVTQIRGSVPQGMEKHELSAQDKLALEGLEI